jgi:hypothetical protein
LAHGLADLTNVAPALDAVGGLTGTVKARQQDRDQQRDDADDDQQLYERETLKCASCEAPFRQALPRPWALASPDCPREFRFVWLVVQPAMLPA